MLFMSCFFCVLWHAAGLVRGHGGAGQHHCHVHATIPETVPKCHTLVISAAAAAAAAAVPTMPACVDGAHP